MGNQIQKLSKIVMISLIAYFLVNPKPVHAVIPPDFIFNIGTQVANFFAVIAVFFVALASTVWHFFKFQISTIKHKPIIASVVLVTLCIAIALSVYAYANYVQKKEYKQWLAASTQYYENETSTTTNSIEKPTTTIPVNAHPAADLSIPLAISNSEFKTIIESTATSYVLLDAREDIEFENGYLPNSVHIRFADLKAGDWAKLPANNRVFVLCWSGIRGKEVAEFLRTHNIVASYLEHGANGWVAYGGAWNGNITFAQKFPEKRYELVFSTTELQKKITEGVFLVDSREPTKFNKKHIPGSVSISLMNTPSDQLEAAFAAVPPGVSVITVCDSYVNCFDAKLTGVELEKRGYTFLGRYNKPWEYVR